MSLLLTILTIVAAALLLSVLAVGLLMILKPLASARGWIEQVTMGVRAIEHHLDDLPRQADAAARSMEAAGATLGRAAAALSRLPPGDGKTGGRDVR
jgi:hypothetical protein